MYNLQLLTIIDAHESSVYKRTYTQYTLETCCMSNWAYCTEQGLSKIIIDRATVRHRHVYDYSCCYDWNGVLTRKWWNRFKCKYWPDIIFVAPENEHSISVRPTIYMDIFLNFQSCFFFGHPVNNTISTNIKSLIIMKHMQLNNKKHKSNMISTASRSISITEQWTHIRCGISNNNFFCCHNSIQAKDLYAYSTNLITI